MNLQKLQSVLVPKKIGSFQKSDFGQITSFSKNNKQWHKLCLKSLCQFYDNAGIVSWVWVGYTEYSTSSHFDWQVVCHVSYSLANFYTEYSIYTTFR